MNPFTPTKFELEQNPVIWLSKFAKNMKQDMKSNFISGSRGSGKTTILRSLSTETILDDQFLRDQHGTQKLKWYGQYLKFNRNFQEYTSQLEITLAKHFDSEQLTERFFCAYLEISLLKFFLDDVLKLQADEKIHIHAATEVTACAELSELFQHSRWFKNFSIFDFHDALRLVNRVRRKFLEFRTDRDFEPLVDLINQFEPSSIISFIQNKAVPAIRSGAFSKGEKIRFYILLDDCENLSDQQQIALNSYLRRTEGDVKWVICFLTERFNITDTNLRNTSLNDDDRELLSLNEIDEGEFISFCEKVTNTRIQNFLETQNAGHYSKKHRQFEISKKFRTNVSYNMRLEQLINRSESQKVVSFLNEVIQTRSQLIPIIKKKSHQKFSLNKDQPLPFVEHVVIEAFDLKLSKYATEVEQRTLDNTIRGKQAFAYIAICAKYFPTPIYVGAEYIVSVSDRCIRDYLDLMGAFFNHFLGNDLSSADKHQMINAAFKFRNDSSVDTNLQDRIIRNASDKKIENLKLSKKSRETMEQFVLSFGELQSLLERDYKDWAAIKQLKRGLFEIEITELAKRSELQSSEVQSLFYELEYDRYIKIHPQKDSGNDDVIQFSLHRRLRPHFGCGHLSSFGNAIEIAPTLAAEILTGTGDFDPKNWASRTYSTLFPVKDANQMELGI